MAIKISGNTVVDDSRNFKNIGNVNITGNVYANTFIGDGSQLTNLPAGGSSVEMTASGNLSDGSKVVVNSDGTVSVAGPDTSVSQSVGTAVAFESGGSTHDVSAVYDTTNNKVVIVYRDGTNSNYGTAVVGTVSGTSISFGTPVVFQSGHVNCMVACYDPYADKVIVANKAVWFNNWGQIRSGSVSGTSISFGSYNWLFTGSMPISPDDYGLAMVFDSTANQVIVAYRATSQYGYARTVSVSGTNLSLGSTAVFSNNAPVGAISLVYDTDQSQLVVIYMDDANNNYLTTTIGTNSNDTLSFGTPVVKYSSSMPFTRNISSLYISLYSKIAVAFTSHNGSYTWIGTMDVSSAGAIGTINSSLVSTSNVDEKSLAWHPEALRLYVAIQYPSNTPYIQFWDISSTTPSYRGAATLDGSMNGSNSMDLVYDEDTKQFVYAITPNNGVAGVYRPAYTPVNLTTENYIGISDGSYTNGTTANIQLVGSVDDAQSGLTTGELYYLQRNGSLATTPDYPSVYVGKALSATQLEIKG